MYGSLFSIKSFVSKISPIDTREGFLFYKTNKYCLHFFESLSGLKFVLNTDINLKGVRELLKEIYKLYVEYAVRNPFFTPGSPINSDLFQAKLDDFIKQSTWIKSFAILILVIFFNYLKVLQCLYWTTKCSI